MKNTVKQIVNEVLKIANDDIIKLPDGTYMISCYRSNPKTLDKWIQNGTMIGIFRSQDSMSTIYGKLVGWKVSKKDPSKKDWIIEKTGNISGTNYKWYRHSAWVK